MKHYPTQLQAYVLTIAVMLGLAVGAHALNAVDKTGKVIGEVINVDSGVVHVVRFHEGQPYIVIVERHRITGTEILWYETIDCTGTAYLIAYDPFSLPLPIISERTGVGPDGQMYIPVLDETFEAELYSLWSRREAGQCIPMLDPETGEGFDPLEEFAWEAMPIGNLETEFTAPYDVK